MKDSIVLEGVLLNDVVSTFSKLGRDAFDSEHPVGCLNSVTNADRTGVTDGHAQGSNVYVDGNGRKHFIVSYDNRDSSMKGRLLVFSEPLYEEVGAMNIEITSEHDVSGKKYQYNHPGSFQIIGDYLFLPIEHYMGKNDESRKYGCEIQVFDLQPLGNDQKPELVAHWSLLPNEDDQKPHRAGMLGVSNEWIGIHDNKVFHLYHIDEFTPSAMSDVQQLQLTSYGSQELVQAEGIALVQEESGDLYLIVLTCNQESNSNGDPWVDRIILYKIKFNETLPYQFKAEEVSNCNLHVYTDPGNGKTGDSSVHFKFGAGVYLVKDTTHESITCFATGREIQKGKRFHFNTFSTEDRIEVTCKSSPLIGQRARASQNFSVKGFSQKSVKFSLYANGKNCTDEVEVNVSRDVDNGSDHSVYGNVGVVDGKKWQDTIEKYSGESPLYFSSPVVPSSYGDNTTLKFIIEGTDKNPTEK